VNDAWMTTGEAANSAWAVTVTAARNKRNKVADTNPAYYCVPSPTASVTLRPPPPPEGARSRRARQEFDGTTVLPVYVVLVSNKHLRNLALISIVPSIIPFDVMWSWCRGQRFTTKRLPGMD